MWGMSTTHAWTSMPVTGLVPAEQAEDPADLVVRNGRIYTGDPRRPYAGAIAIRDGRILAVGDDYGMARHITQATRVVDVMGRRVIPGLIDAHMHVMTRTCT
jgi:predicted amidohydrolase YtcJ